MKWSRCRWVAAVAAVMVISVGFGCGGDGGGGGDGGNPSGPQNLAPTSISEQTLTLNSTATRELRFDSAGLWIEDRDGTFHGGTYQYTASGNSAELILSESGVSSTIRLTFSSADSGAYVEGQDQGTFRLQTSQSNPDDPGSPNNPGGLAPASLSGRTLHGTRTFTSTGPKGQTHIYTFAGSNFHDSDPPEESDGTYVYQPAGDGAVLTLSYTAPTDFDGDQHRIEMSFSTATTGSFQSLYTRRDGTTIQINGTFQIE